MDGRWVINQLRWSQGTGGESEFQDMDPTNDN